MVCSVMYFLMLKLVLTLNEKVFDGTFYEQYR
jgi:hypothetical protein